MPGEVVKSAPTIRLVQYPFASLLCHRVSSSKQPRCATPHHLAHPHLTGPTGPTRPRRPPPPRQRPQLATQPMPFAHRLVHSAACPQHALEPASTAASTSPTLARIGPCCGLRCVGTTARRALVDLRAGAGTEEWGRSGRSASARRLEQLHLDDERPLHARLATAAPRSLDDGQQGHALFGVCA